MVSFFLSLVILSKLSFVQDESIRKRDMIPLDVFKSSSIERKPWHLYVTDPWSIMTWGMKQVRGILMGGSERDYELPVRELVLVENLQVCFVISY